MVGSLEGRKIVQAHKADDWATGTHNSSSIATKSHSYALVILNAGTVGVSGTIDVTVEESDVSGSGYTAVTGAAFVQIDSARDDGVYTGHLNLNARKAFIRVVAVVGTATCGVGVTVLLSPDDTRHDTNPIFSV
tara:strand:+ start:768 stop:1169 length:402 start_codon:yes stop_codon:yes gene_type:complete